MDITNEIEKRRQTSADYHLYMAKKWRVYGESTLSHSPLIYSAFELRLGIERFVIEIFYLIRKENLIESDEFTEGDIKRIDRFSSLLAVLYQDVGNKKRLYRAFYYNKMHVQIFISVRINLSIPDLGKLHRYWEELSNYCHRQLEPAKTWENDNWISAGYEKLNEIEEYFWNLIGEKRFGWLNTKSLPPELFELRNDFLNEKIDEKQLIKRMELLKPLLDYKLQVRDQIEQFRA